MRTKLLFFIILLGSKLLAQRDDGPVYFGNIGATGPAGATAGATFIGQNEWGCSIAYNFMVPHSKNKPSDYQAGSWAFLGDDIYDAVGAVAVRGLKSFPTGSQKIRFAVEAGAAWVKTSVADRFVAQNIAPDIFGNYANYRYEDIESTSFGLSLRGSFSWTFSRLFGLEIGVISNINPDRSYFGLDTVLIFGHVRDRL